MRSLRRAERVQSEKYGVDVDLDCCLPTIILFICTYGGRECSSTLEYHGSSTQPGWFLRQIAGEGEHRCQYTPVHASKHQNIFGMSELWTYMLIHQSSVCHESVCLRDDWVYSTIRR
jgi:hypothetical protein